MSKINTKVSTPAFLNYIRENAGQYYRNTVPLCDGTNGKELANMVLSDSGLTNAFLNTMINKVGLTVFSNRRYEQPLSAFKKGKVESGDMVEQIFVDLIAAKEYNKNASAADIYAQAPPDVKTVYYQVNCRRHYDVTINRALIRGAFYSMQGVERLVNVIISKMYTSKEVDDLNYNRSMIKAFIKEGPVHQVVVEPITPTTSNAFCSKLREISDNFLEETNLYTRDGVYNHAQKEEQVLLIKNSAKSILDVETLARSFNIGKAEFLGGNVVGLTSFKAPGDTEILMDCVEAILTTKDFFQVYDYELQAKIVENPESLDYKYILHVWSIYATNRFENFVVFTNKAPEITTYSISPKTLTLNKGDSAKFIVTVDGTGILNSDSTFTLSGQLSPNTTIRDDGYLVLGSDETASTITVTATSLLDSTKKDTATVTVNQGT